MSGNNTGRRLITALALTTLPLALLYTHHAISNQPEPVRHKPSVSSPRVSVMPLQVGTYQSQVRAFGEVRALDEISLNSEVSGTIIWKNPNFVVGGRLRKGEQLVRVDNTEYQSRLAATEQSLAEAHLALQQEQRQQQQALLDWKRSGIKDSPSALVLREPQLQAAKARLKAAKASVKQARRELALTQISAPFDAVVLRRDVAAGSYLNQGAAVATLRSSNRAEISLALSADQWQQLPADPSGITVSLSSGPQNNNRWNGKVSRLSQNIDQQTRLRRLVVAVDHPLDQQPALLFGNYVEAQIKGKPVESLFALPASALTAQGYLWHVVDGQLQRVERSPLFSADDQLFINRGELPERIQLVRNPVSSYLDGMTVITSSTPSNEVVQR